MLNIWKLEKILNHQNELHFNVPYDDNQAELWATEHKLDKANDQIKELEERYSLLQNKFQNFWDIPIQTELGEKFPWSGYIDINGNIGEIDGIKYKIAGAVKRHMDVVLVPPSNYEEAMQVVKDNNYHIDIVKISTFDEAIKYLLK